MIGEKYIIKELRKELDITFLSVASKDYYLGTLIEKEGLFARTLDIENYSFIAKLSIDRQLKEDLKNKGI